MILFLFSDSKCSKGASAAMSIEDTGFKPDTDRKTAGCCVNKMKPGYKERLRMYQPAAVKDPLLTCIKGDKFRFIVLSHYYNRFSCFNAKKKRVFSFCPVLQAAETLFWLLSL